VTVKGPKAELTERLPQEVSVEVGDGKLQVVRKAETRRCRAMHGLARALLQNMVTGVSKGFTLELEINGVGYRADVKDKLLTLALGYSHPIEVVVPDGITVTVDKNRIKLGGSSRSQLGQFAAIIREQRPPEPYKGKGIKYIDEQIRRKVGKAGAG
jgi:large subunit ribosomal protein L6